ncbi:MAG: PQQ-binding-like beta-propeller repeat protein [Bacteroidales bacterium]|nr:PQQ-binding-like beta-propeller repeat protein [Bacteroidales bacterium]
MKQKALKLIFILFAALLPCIFVSAQESLRWAFMADLHVSVDSRSADDLRACVKDINAQDVDFVIVAGDVTNFGSDKEIRLAKGILDSLKVPCHVVPGNHDAKWSESGCNSFKEIFGGESFVFRQGGWRFVGCASGPNMRMAPALLPRENMVMLEELGRQEKEKTIFINHYPLDSSVLNYFDITKALHRLDTRFVMGGHWHVNRAMSYDGIPAVIGRSSMTTTKVNSGYNIVSLKDDHITIHERRLDAEGRFSDLPAWYEAELRGVASKAEYDADGLPLDYPWMSYDINRKYPQIKELWTILEDSDIASGFAVDSKEKYAWYNTTSGRLRKIRLRDGAVKWSITLPGKVFSTPALSEDGKTLVTGCADGHLYAFNAKNGKLRWKVKAGSSILCSPVIFEEKVYFGASDGVFRCVKVGDGAEVWSYEGVEGFVECRPWVDKDGVFFGAWDRNFYCLDSENGALRWKWNVGKASIMYSPAACWPVKSGKRVFVAVPDRRVYCLDAENGEMLFFAEGGREQIGLSPDGGRVFVKTMHHRAYCFDADIQADSTVLTPQRQRWNISTCLGYDIAPTPTACAGNELLIPSDKGSIVALDASDGSLLWAHKLSPALVNPLAVLKSPQGKYRVLCSTFDGKISVLVVER